MSQTLEAAIETIEDLMEENELEQADAALSKAFNEFGQEDELLVIQAELLLEQEDLEGVIAIAGQAKESDDDELEARMLAAKGYAQYYLDELDSARQSFNAAIRADPELLTAVIGRAMTHENIGYYAAAMIDLDRAIDMDEQVGQPWAIRGAIHLHFGRIDEALRDLGFAVESEPEDEESRLNLARIHALQTNTSAAIELLEPLIEQGEDPDFVAPGALLRSQLSLTLGSFEPGLEDAEKAITLIPELPWGYLQAAACVLTSGADPGRAIEFLKDAETKVKDIRDIPDIFLLYSTAYKQLGKEEQAKTWADRAEGSARLPGFVYGQLNPAQNIPINPNKPVDVRALLDQLFGEAANAPENYESVIREVIDKIPELVKENPGVGQLQIELPDAPGMVGNRALVIQVGQAPAQG